MEADRALAAPGAIGEADLVLGVLTYQHARTVAEVVGGLEKGMQAHFPDARAVIVHADAGSTDGTVEAAAGAAAALPLVRLETPLAAGDHVVPAGGGVPRADALLAAVCRAAAAVGARAMLVVGADLRTLPDEWMERLLRPVWRGELDFVTPLFARPVLDGTLTSCLLYPLTRALYGASVRNVVAAEMALSPAVVERLAAAPAAGRSATRSGTLYASTTAAATGARLGDAWLGARAEEPREGRQDLGEIMSTMVGAAFALAELYEESWRELPSRPPPCEVGEPVLLRSDPTAASQARMVAVFRQGLRDLQPIWEQALSAGTLGDLYPLGDQAPDEFVFGADLWARVVYDFLLAWRYRVLHRDHLLRSLVPLYLGRLAALCREAAGLPGPAQARLLERQAQAFERARVDLADRWR